jgi:hypothetical protein
MRLGSTSNLMLEIVTFGRQKLRDRIDAAPADGAERPLTCNLLTGQS